MKGGSMNWKKVELFLVERLPWILVVGIYVVFIFLLPELFLSPSWILNILRRYSSHGLLSVALAAAVISGSMDVSLPAIGGFAGVFVVEFGEVWFPGTPSIVLLLLPLIIGAVIGCINGLIISMAGVNPFFVTLATSLIFQGVRKLIRPGSLWIKYSEILLFPGLSIVGGFTFSILFMLIMILFVWFLVSSTRLGARIYAIGGSEASSKIMGINTKNIRLIVHTLAGMLAGLAGLIYVGDLEATSPEMMDLWTFTLFAIIVFGGITLEGGKGSIVTTVAGMLFIAIVDVGGRLLGISVHLNNFVIGILILVGVIINSSRDKIIDRLLMTLYQRQQ